MKIPDKIYVPPFSTQVHETPLTNEDIEFIRKDVLLAWVEKMEQAALKDIEDGKPVKGNLTTWRRIAIKIESM